MQKAEVGAGMLTGGYEHEIDSVTPLSPLGFEAEVFLPGKNVHFMADVPPGDTLDFKLAAVLSSGAGSGSDDDEVSEVESFILDQEDNSVLKTVSELFLSTAAEVADLRTVDPATQARLEAVLEAAGIGKLSTADGKAFADPEVLQRLTSSVSCALDEAAAALTRMRADSFHTGQVDNRSLAEACSDGDVNAVRKLLNEGRSVNEHTKEGESLLCLACSAGYYELVQVLLAMHANVEDRGNKGDITPLMAAASGGFVDIVKVLLLHSADVNAQSSTGNTALTYACAGGFVDVVKVLLEEGANIEEHNENGHTALMEAASAGHVDVARILLENGAGINAHSNEFKESALTLACYKGHLEMVRFLLEAGADQEHKTDEMHTALMEACMDGHVGVASLLLDSGAQVNMPADSFESPLTLAACGGHVELAALLIERGANLEEVNDEGYTPLMEAAREGHEEIVALLIAQGANINAQTEETQETALTLACCGGFAEVTDFLVKSGADVELGCSTPLMEAAQEGHLELVKYLLSAGADVHASTATGDTALTYACENGHTDVAEALLQADADLEHESEGGRTPLMKAARAGHLCTVQFLISQGADINKATANNDHTVVSLACAGGHLAIVELLLAKGADPTHRLKDGSTMLIEAAKGGHTNVVSYLLDYPNNILSSATSTDGNQIIPTLHDQFAVSCVPMHTIATVVPPREPDKPPDQIDSGKGASKKSPNNIHASGKEQRSLHPFQPLECIVEETEGKLSELGQRISAIERAQMKSLELIQGEPLNKDKIEELKKNREEQVQKKKKILKELQKVERQLQMKAQQQVTKEIVEDTPSTETAALQPFSVSSESTLSVEENIFFNEKCIELDRFGTGGQKVLAQTCGEEMPKSMNNFGLSGMASSESVVSCSKVALDRPSINSHVTSQVADNLMIAPPAQTLNDTLDDIMAGVSGKIPSMTDSDLATTMASSVPQSDSGSQDEVPLPPGFAPVNIDAHTESNHDTALTLGCAGGHVDVVTLLIMRCANIEHRDKKGLTPLALAASAGHAKIVEILLDKGADIETPCERSKDTPLSVACSAGRLEVVELLLSRGANKEHRNVSDYTPLSLAASGGYVHIIKTMLNAGAEINSRTGSKLGISPLMLASMNGHVAAVKLLLDMGSDINAQIETNRNTALTLACFQGRTEVVSLLLDRKANVEHRAKSGLNPLMEAASGGYAEVGRVLLDKGADVNCPPVPSSRDTALTIAADKGHYKFCELLINRGAHIDVKNKKGNTPMWLAANGGHFDVVKLLVHAGGDVNAADNRKITPLLSAFRKGHVKIVQFLVKEVNQFPSDVECMKYIATITDNDLLKKCRQCMETIMKAKDQQAAEANKNASILLEELDLEKSREESRKQALAAKRVKRKEKRKKKKELQKKKLGDDDCKHSLTCDVDAEDEHSDEEDVPLEPPSATTMTTIGISATSASFTNAFGKRIGKIITPSTNQKNKKDHTEENLQLVAPGNNRSKKSKKKNRNGRSEDASAVVCDFVILDSDECNSETPVYKNQECKRNATTRTCSVLFRKLEDEPEMVTSKVSASKQPSCIDKTTPLTLPNPKLNVCSPKRGQKREEGWKEVVRRSKKLFVPASVVSRIMGRGGCNITAIQDVTGAHIDVDKQTDKNGQRMITIRGGTESTRHVVQLINALIQDPAKELEDLIPKGHIRSPKTLNSASGAGMVSTSKSPATATSSMTRVLTSSMSSKQTKNIQENIYPPLHRILPMPNSHPRFVHLTVQPMIPVRPTHLPLVQNGVFLRPPICTWGPFSPKHTLQETSTAQTDFTSKLNDVSQHSKSPSSIGKQLFPCNLKTSSGVSVCSDPASTTISNALNSSTPPSAGETEHHLPTKETTVSNMLNSSTPPSAGETEHHLPTKETTVSNALNSSTPSSAGETEHHLPTKETTVSNALNSSTPPSAGETEHHLPTKEITVSNALNSSTPPSPGETEHHLPTKETTRRPLDQTAEMRFSSGINWPENSSFTSDQKSFCSTSPSAYSSKDTLSGGTSERNEAKVAAYVNDGGAEPDSNCRLPHIAHANQYAMHNMQYRNPVNSVTSTKQMQQDGHTHFDTDLPPCSTQDSLQKGNTHSPQVHLNLANKQLPLPFGPARLNRFSTPLNQLPCSQGWGGGLLSAESNNQFLTGPDNSILGEVDHFRSLPASNPPGFRPTEGHLSGPVAFFDNSDNRSLGASVPPMTSFEKNLYQSPMFLQGPNVCSPSFSRQHFAPHPWNNSSDLSLSGSTSPPPSTDPQSSGLMQPLYFTDDRKKPPPIGTERLARIRQSGRSCAFGNTYTPSVGQNGIWSFGVNSEPDGFSGWSQPLMNPHVYYHPQPDNTVFSQHQYVERDEYGVLYPSNALNRPISSTVIDSSKALPGTWTSPYGNNYVN